MECRKTVEVEERNSQPQVRHCAVCFAPIGDSAAAARSQEGHHYCARCADAMFKAGALEGLRHDSQNRMPKHIPSA
ncbi:hypothetical protein GKC30_05830 [Pseudodesulfovibrio sp. F-1]|uniref:Uncharacterized protein n=1 Tax=Pseudodesulfovibrio alkaliphilus TaxID=2661613 RepID=A0A7K1KMB0_9BACT|nr:hypothetical protein [Pseudodesulfovibrio alkaliphilus]MUM77147.1 hypothetical protein [Pseudodesulfovibrio alkaliphilus]